MNLRCEISEALFYGIKPGESPKKGEMRRPDMGRHVDRLGTQLQYDFQKIMAVQSQNRASIRMDIAYGLQPGRNPIRFL